MMGDRGTKRHILVVDDDSALCETLAMALDVWGHSSVCVHSGSEALDVFEPGKFDLVLTDYLMPAMTGDKLAAAIKALSPTQPILMLSAYADNFWPGSPILSCVDGLLTKPFKLDVLARSVLELARPSKASAI
jgi:CheY-like chemotaxis protein